MLPDLPTLAGGLKSALNNHGLIDGEVEIIDDAVVVEIAGQPGGVGLSVPELESLEIPEGDFAIQVGVAGFGEAHQDGRGVDRLPRKRGGLCAGDVEEISGLGDR